MDSRGPAVPDGEAASITASRRAGWGGFLRLWFVLLFSYVLLRLLIDLIVAGYVDLRTVTAWQLLVLPLGQAIVLWVVTQRARRG